MQRKELHLKALLRVQQAYKVAQGTPEVLAKVLICIGAAVEGIPQPRDGKTARQQYWESLMSFVKEITKGRKLASGEDFNFVSLEEYERAQLACALYEQAHELWPSESLAKNYIERIHLILSGEKRVFTNYSSTIGFYQRRPKDLETNRNRTQFRMVKFF